jgi:hypothetical protein
LTSAEKKKINSLSRKFMKVFQVILIRLQYWMFLNFNDFF